MDNRLLRVPVAAQLRLLRLHSHSSGGRQKLKAELATFEVRNVKAWCCEVSHVLPDGEQIPCDRVFVEASIKTWYGKEDQDGLEVFNSQVKTELSAHVADFRGKESVMTIQFLVLQTIFLAIDIQKEKKRFN